MKTIAEIREAAIAEHTRRLEVLGRIEKYYDALATDLAELDPHVYVDMFDLNVTFTGGKLSLEKAFKILRSKGFVPDERPKEKDTKFATYFRQADGASVWLSFSSSVCKRVQIGTRTVEEPVYEIQCDDSPPVAVVFVDPEAEMPF